MNEPSTTPLGSGPGASLPGTQDRAGRADVGGTGGVSRPGAGGGGTEDAERLAKQGAQQIGREVRDLKDSAKQGAADAAGRVREQAGQAAQQVGQQVSQQASQMASQLKERGAELFEQQKTRAADLIGDCVAATRRAAQKLHDENDHNLAGYADAFAEGLDRTGQYLRQQDPRKLVDDAADLARRRPEWVLGGAFVVGLAVARFLKASRPGGAAYGSYRYDRPEDYGGGYRGGYEGGGYDAGYGTGYGAGYTGGYGGGVREYGSPLTSPGDAFGQRTDPASTFPGAAPGTRDTPGVATTATGSWAATGGGAAGTGSTGTGVGSTGGTAPAASGPDPTIPGTRTASDLNLDPARRDNPEAL